MRGGAFLGHEAGHVRVDDAGAGGDGVARVRSARRRAADRGGHAALRPGRRAALAKRRRGQHGHLQRRAASAP